MTVSYDPVLGRIYGMKDYSWQTADCACFGKDPNLFIHSSDPGDRAGHVARKKAKQAKAICARCPVATREACLEFALTEPAERDGVWGGLDRTERRQLAALRSLRRKGLAS